MYTVLPAVPRLTLATAVVAMMIAGCSEPTTAVPTPNGFTLAPSLDATSESSGRYLVVFDTTAVPSDLAARVEALGGSVAVSMDAIGVAVVDGLTSDAASQLGASADVAQMGADDEITLNLVDEIPAVDSVAADATPASPAAPNTAFFFPRQWHHRVIGADRAWAAGRVGSDAVKVFILDTGIDYTYRDLAGRVNLALSRSFIPSDDAFLASRFPGAHPVADLHYHGTHVASTVSSNSNVVAGVTSGVTLVGVKVLSRSGSGPLSAILRGIMYAADNDADVANMSLGGGFFKQGNGAFVAAVQRATNYAFSMGTLVIVAAGNESLDLDHDGSLFKTYCGASNVLCISATGPTAQAGVNGPWTNVDAFAAYSNYGRSAVNVAAPGGFASFVWEACSRFSQIVPICGTGTFTLGLTGTSMATPHVSGLAALLVETIGKDKPAQVRAAIIQSADDLGQSGNDPYYGKGRINVARALGLQ